MPDNWRRYVEDRGRREMGSGAPVPSVPSLEDRFIIIPPGSANAGGYIIMPPGSVNAGDRVKMP